MARMALSGGAALSLIACAVPPVRTQTQTSLSVVTAPGAAPSPAPPRRVPTTPSTPEPVPPPTIDQRPCGAFDCRAFATPEAAFRYVLTSDPRILAVGEAHAQQGLPGIRSSTRRFAEQLLPLLAGRSKHIVIELLVAHCKEQTVAGVQKQQAPVTEHQAKSNQNDFLTLGKFAQHLGIEPEALSPECSAYESVLAAGDDGVARLLGLVADTTADAVEALLAKQPAGREILLSYGGALHNDLYPRPGQEAWSFGPRLSAASSGGYVELDLIVPEFVKDTESWRSLPWFSAFDRQHLSEETLLYEPAPHSFALIFPKTGTPGAQ